MTGPNQWSLPCSNASPSHHPVPSSRQRSSSSPPHIYTIAPFGGGTRSSTVTKTLNLQDDSQGNKCALLPGPRRFADRPHALSSDPPRTAPCLYSWYVCIYTLADRVPGTPTPPGDRLPIVYLYQPLKLPYGGVLGVLSEPTSSQHISGRRVYATTTSPRDLPLLPLFATCSLWPSNKRVMPW